MEVTDSKMRFLQTGAKGGCDAQTGYNTFLHRSDPMLSASGAAAPHAPTAGRQKKYEGSCLVLSKRDWITSKASTPDAAQPAAPKATVSPAD